MKLVSVKNTRIVNSTSLQGYVKTSYRELVDLFGLPRPWDGDGKTRVEWILTPEYEEVPITIYDWKETIPVEKVTDWHIGGRSQLAIELMKKVLPQTRSMHDENVRI